MSLTPKNSSGTHSRESWTIPHILEDVVLASDVMGVRAFGSTAAETVSGKVLDRLQAMKNKIDTTLAFPPIKSKAGNYC